MLWAAGLQLSQDRSGYLVQHANKTAVASPTGSLPAAFSCNSGQLFLTTLLPGNELLHFSNFRKRCHPFPNPSETDVCLWGEMLPAPGYYLRSVIELSGLQRTRRWHSGISLEDQQHKLCVFWVCLYQTRAIDSLFVSKYFRICCRTVLILALSVLWLTPNLNEHRKHIVCKMQAIISQAS